ncbi:IS30 family transposase [bacterium]|nr:IS30 family transposase [bacterium]
MRKYHQLNREERYQIERLIQEGKTVEQIALSIGFHRSSIYRELNRNSISQGGYRALEAWRRTKFRRRRQDFGPAVKIKDWVEERVLDGLRKAWSPEQICGRLKLEQGFSVSPEAVYKYILKDRKYGGSLFKCLRRRGKRRRMRKASRFLPVWEPRRRIQERSDGANDRTELGHWERDTMVGANHEGGVLVFTDRKSRLVLLNKVRNLNSEETLHVSLDRFQSNPHLPRKTMTNDNGGEFAKHKELETVLGIPVYFADPYAPWQRGSNENSIGLIRQFLPKGTNLKSLSEDRLKKIEVAINTRPRKIFGFRCAQEVVSSTELHFCSTEKHGEYEQKILEAI